MQLQGIVSLVELNNIASRQYNWIHAKVIASVVGLMNAKENPVFWVCIDPMMLDRWTFLCDINHDTFKEQVQTCIHLNKKNIFYF